MCQQRKKKVARATGLIVADRGGAQWVQRVVEVRVSGGRLPAMGGRSGCGK